MRGDGYLVQVWQLSEPHKICTGVKEQAYFDTFDEAWIEQKRLLNEGTICSIIKDSK